MNRYESDMWAEASRKDQDALNKRNLRENGSMLSRSLKTVLSNCYLSKQTKEELKKNLDLEEEKTSRILKEWDYY